MLIKYGVINSYKDNSRINNIEYFYKNGDGHGEVNGLYYESSRNITESQEYIKKYLARQGYEISEWGYPDYVNGDFCVHVDCENIGLGSRIVISASKQLK